MESIHKKISLVVSIYKVEDYLDKCIYSLRNQTYKNIEIVLVVRNSGDRCVDICKAHKAEDNRIVIVFQAGRGLVNARKEGTLSASGDYVIHIDGDDWVDDDWLESAAAHLENNRPDMLYLMGLVQEGRNKVQTVGSIQKHSFIGEEICREIFPMFMDIEKSFKWNIRWNVWSWIVKRDILLQQQMLIDDSITLIEDAVYVFLCLLKAKSVVWIDNGNYHYILREDSGMRTPIGIQEGNLEGAYNLLKENFQQSDHAYKLNRFLDIFIRHAIFCWEYSAFQFQFEKYLYPYIEVKARSKVIVYGAGRFGRQVVNVIMDRDDYSLVGWIDRNTEQDPSRDRKIQPICDVIEMKYDYIVIAILDRDMVLEARDSLLQMGVPDKKIAMMDVEVIAGSRLPWQRSGYTEK